MKADIWGLVLFAVYSVYIFRVGEYVYRDCDECVYGTTLPREGA